MVAVIPPAIPFKPKCHNRPEYTGRWEPTDRIVQNAERVDGRIVMGLAKRVYRWRPYWATTGCVTWRGTGIGQPTPEYPSGTPYPIAHGYDCTGCRHLPEGVIPQQDNQA